MDSNERKANTAGKRGVHYELLVRPVSTGCALCLVAAVIVTVPLYIYSRALPASFNLAALLVSLLLVAWSLFVPFFRSSIAIGKRLAWKLKGRPAIPSGQVISALASDSAVPEKFAHEFLRSLAWYYSPSRRLQVEPGMIRPTDRFDRDLSMDIEQLPKRQARWARRELPKRGFDSIGAVLLAYWLLDEWYESQHQKCVEAFDFNTSEELTGKLLDHLEAIASDAHVSVSDLCTKLYELNISLGLDQ